MRSRPPRFPIERPVSFVRRTRGPSQKGSGSTRNISKGGVLFSTDAEFLVGEAINLVVCLSDAPGRPPVNLRAQGRVMRKQDGAVAVKMYRGSLRPLPAHASE